MRRQPKARTTKSKSRIDDFYKIKEAAHQRRNDHKVQLEIEMHRMGSKIMELEKISKSFGDLAILDQFEYVFQRGERIGIIGKNGTGKIVILKLTYRSTSFGFRKSSHWRNHKNRLLHTGRNQSETRPKSNRGHKRIRRVHPIDQRT